MFCLLVFGGGRRTCLEEEEEDEENASTNHVPRSSPTSTSGGSFAGLKATWVSLARRVTFWTQRGSCLFVVVVVGFFFPRKGFLGCGMYEGGLRVMY